MGGKGEKKSVYYVSLRVLRDHYYNWINGKKYRLELKVIIFKICFIYILKFKFWFKSFDMKSNMKSKHIFQWIVDLFHSKSWGERESVREIQWKIYFCFLFKYIKKLFFSYNI